MLMRHGLASAWLVLRDPGSNRRWGAGVSGQTDTADRSLCSGGGVDIMGRIVAGKLTERFGTQVIVENRGGGGR